MNKRDRLRRIVIVCTIFFRNLAYYREGWKHPSGWTDEPLAASANFWRTANTNFIDICVLEWCKLFGDKRGTRNGGRHAWWRIVSDPDCFESGLLAALNSSAAEFEALRLKMREYRDKFLAHLDSDATMHVPELSLAEASMKFYHAYIIANEATAGDLMGLPDSLDRLEKGYQQSLKEAALAYNCLSKKGAVAT